MARHVGLHAYFQEVDGVVTSWDRRGELKWWSTQQHMFAEVEILNGHIQVDFLPGGSRSAIARSAGSTTLGPSPTSTTTWASTSVGQRATSTAAEGLVANDRSKRLAEDFGPALAQPRESPFDGSVSVSKRPKQSYSASPRHRSHRCVDGADELGELLPRRQGRAELRPSPCSSEPKAYLQPQPVTTTTAVAMPSAASRRGSRERRPGISRQAIRRHQKPTPRSSMPPSQRPSESVRSDSIKRSAALRTPSVWPTKTTRSMPGS